MPRASPAPRSRAFDWRGFLVLCAIYVAVALLWNTPAVLPLKLFVVLLHELSHAAAALLTGGRVVEMYVGDDQGGHCRTTGGLPFLVVSAGYVGSLLFGATLLLVAARTRASRLVAALLGTLVAVAALRYMTHAGFGRSFAALSGVVLAALALCPDVVSGTALRVIGVTSCLYAILDIKHDVLDRDHPLSDASQLAAMTGVPAFFWGLLWIGVSLVVTVFVAKWAVTGGRPRRSPRKAP